MLHLKALPSTQSIILQTTLISLYNFKRLFLQIENYSINILKPHKLNSLGTKRHHRCWQNIQNFFLQNIKQYSDQHYFRRDGISFMKSWWITIFRNQIITNFALGNIGELKIGKDDLPFERRGLKTTKT